MSRVEAPSDLPPTYTEYPTELPAQLPIGPHQVAPIVNVTELQAHLRLLGAIHKLKEVVQCQEDGIATTDRELGWIVFVNRAVYRFFAWTAATWQKTSPSLNETYIPPLDVIMVWHAYLLNPRSFFEDSRRMSTTYCTNLIAIEEMPLTLISSLIDPKTLDPLPPSDERQRFFEETTNLPYDMPLITKRSDVFTLDCPFCANTNQLVRWVADGEKGFAQPKFAHTCEICGESFRKSNIGVRRFCEEVTRRRAGDRVFISETFLSPSTGLSAETSAVEIMMKLLKWMDSTYQVLQPIPAGSDVDTEATKLAKGLGYNYLLLSNALHRGARPNITPDPNRPIPRLQRISVAYSHAGLASLDLVGAILRQGSFIQKMAELGWTRPGRFDLVSKSAPLVRSIARYHAFLDLMAANKTSFFVPTLDLAWHTHQLRAWQYRDDSCRFLQRVPNHDDNVEPLLLSKGYDITAKAWKARFGVPYSVCGCVPDGDSESLLSRFTSKIIGNSGSSHKRDSSVSSIDSTSSSGHKREKSVTTLEPVVNSRPDLVSTEEDEADASHPSEHNQQFGDPDGRPAFKAAYLREKRSAKCVASAKKGASRDPWRGLQAERNERRKEHKEAFTDPHYGSGAYYPYWGVSVAIPLGFYGGYAVLSVGGCGGGCGSCGGGGCGGGCGGCGG
ncbi:hypothetical protein FRC18_002927 [Serendipita sp. 400]|nr:hypothetical protein FRC18_002927 [Serendipita sp. 400]